MEPGIINQAIKKFCLSQGKDLKEVIQYLKLKYQIDADESVLRRRLEKIVDNEKAVA
ncbi:Clr5 domain-containing protein [Algoriphagus vanfongensis]|uniref:Clr5 domain-containing protein n=1 Tax=Algoriphagus vanfongensis TaxID=426371 RepID=UPI0004006D6F|nr:Clr5 domain-containing protein [Algoriphagus vanfongensis]